MRHSFFDIAIDCTRVSVFFVKSSVVIGENGVDGALGDRRRRRRRRPEVRASAIGAAADDDVIILLLSSSSRSRVSSNFR